MYWPAQYDTELLSKLTLTGTVFSFRFFLINAHVLCTCDLLFSLESLFLAIKHLNVFYPITVMAHRLVAPCRAFLMSTMRQTLTVSSLVRSTASQPDHFTTFFGIACKTC